MLTKIWTYLKTSYSFRLLPSSPPLNSVDCPNCWGQQEWEQCYQEIKLDLDRALIAKGQVQAGFIRRFVQERIG